MLQMNKVFRSGVQKIGPCFLCRKHFQRLHRLLHILEGSTDKYNGVTVDLSTIPANTSQGQFGDMLSKSLSKWRQRHVSAVWLKVPIAQSQYITVAAQEGFEYHHAEHDSALLKLWLRENRPDATPRFATHQVGVSGMVINEDTTEVLVVKDKNSRFNLWKFPGGLSNLEEDLGDTAVREVFEETGVKTEFKSVLAMRQQHTQPGAWGRSDFFIVCRLKPLTFDINYCTEEIKACEWMKITDMRKEINVSSITFRMTSIALYGMENGFDKVDIQSEEMNSVYKGLKYKLYHRPLPEQWMQGQ